MPETPEVPEAKDSFEKRVAISIAIIAVALSFVGNYGDNAKTDALRSTTLAANQWGYYQAKNIRGHTSKVAAESLSVLAASDTAARDKVIAELNGQNTKYEKDKAEIKAEAEKLEKEATHLLKVNDRCDQASLLLQLAVILCSVSILVRLRWFWYGGVGLGAIGAAVGASALLL